MKMSMSIVLYSHCSPYQTMHLADIMIKNGENNFQPRALYGVAVEGRGWAQKFVTLARSSS